MDDTLCRDYFCQPTNTYHRHYEALRAIFVEGRALQEVATAFGYSYKTLAQLVHEFRQHCRSSNPSDPSPFFESPRSEDPQTQSPPQQ